MEIQLAFNLESYGLELCNLLTQSKVDDQFNNAAIYLYDSV